MLNLVNEFVIRPAIPSEQQYLEALVLRSSVTNPKDHEALLAHPDAIELPLEQIVAGDVFVLELQGRIVGFAALKSRPDGDADLDGLFVEPDIRRRGVGRSLVAHCMQIARSRGSAALHVIGNPYAQDFYLACGFSLTGSSQTRFGPALLMRISL